MADVGGVVRRNRPGTKAEVCRMFLFSIVEIIKVEFNLRHVIRYLLNHYNN